MYFDGSLKLEGVGAGAGVLLIFPTSNNSSTSCRSFERSETTKPSTKLYYTGFTSQLPWASSDY
jgi:hypothetical protein